MLCTGGESIGCTSGGASERLSCAQENRVSAICDQWILGGLCEQLIAVIFGLSRTEPGGVLSLMSDDQFPISCTFCAVANTSLELRTSMMSN